MSMRSDYLRWNRAFLKRFRYVDGNAIHYLEDLRSALTEAFPQVDTFYLSPDDRKLDVLTRLLNQYNAERRDMGWEILRSFARAAHVLMEHADAYANEGYLATATQWDNVRRLVALLDYRPAPPASARSQLALITHPDQQGGLPAGFQVKHTPPDGSQAIIFETLQDVEVFPKLNSLRPQGYLRNPDPLTGNIIEVEGILDAIAVDDLLILENEANQDSKGFLIKHINYQANTTQITLHAALPQGRVRQSFTKGNTRVHLLPKDQLIVFKPKQKGIQTCYEFYLDQVPDGIQENDPVYITDGNRYYYHAIKTIKDTIVSLYKASGDLILSNTYLAKPDNVTAESIDDMKEEPGPWYRIKGDYTRLAEKIVAEPHPDNKGTFLHYRVITPTYQPIVKDSKNIHQGYTLLRFRRAEETRYAQLFKPEKLLVPPINYRQSRADSFILKEKDNLPNELTTQLPKAVTLGDFIMLVQHGQLFWTKVEHIKIDSEQEQATLSTATWQHNTLKKRTYLSQTTLYGHFSKVVRIADWQINNTDLSGKKTIALTSVPDELSVGHSIIIQREDDQTLNLHSKVSAIDASNIVIADPLSTGSTPNNTVIYANVVTIGHGESQAETVLGSGDATQSNASYILPVDNISFITDPRMPSGVRADLVITVNQQIWQQVADLKYSAPTDAHFSVHVTEENHLKINFGDGKHGRRLPTGTNNIRIRYRIGNGLAGNLPAFSLTNIVKPHRYIKQAQQLLRTDSGNDKESLANLRDNAPASVLTLNRAVSTQDFANLVNKHSSVWQANAFLRPHQGRRESLVEIIVVPAGGSELSSGLQQALHDHVQAHALPGIRIAINSYQAHYLHIKITGYVRTQLVDVDELTSMISVQLRHHFHVTKRKLGQPVYRSEIYKIVENISGIENCICQLRTEQGTEFTRANTLIVDDNALLYLDDDDKRSELQITLEEYVP